MNYAAVMNPAMNPAPYPPTGTAGMNMAAIQSPYPPTGTESLLTPLLYPPAHSDGGMGVVSGYEGMADGSGQILPPPPDMFPGPVVPAPVTTPDWTIPSISENTAKEAFLEYANSHCCYGTGPATDMVLQKMQPFNTYRYRLETFTESRDCEWVTAPYTGQTVDSSAYGPAPLPWELVVPAPTFIKDETHKVPVPHTSSMKPCPQCLGIGKIVCTKCHGVGRVQCTNCNGKGRKDDEDCSDCSANGTQSCKECSSTCHVICTGCTGRGQVLNYIQLNVTWKNNIFEFIADHKSEFPTDHFKAVNGEKMFTDEQFMVPPIMNFPDPTINQTSQNALQQHHSQFASTSRILRQRQTIEWLPLTLVEYNWKGDKHNYFVYGKENKVYTKKYPATCCCCVIL
ncbi:LOW QUALITY PROTEIN: protein SSUH2 homolog [Bombina bombina]|uniref:LOW QUALITY PROTEIN: protein SSUH2 homolog n=1 Tax=Bombina bombina TaxID=8345 RepID=UPI00235AEF01|nr:LOW QUALITY PROTEIN: protein SSUH2 homolog [Bombina bombina]